MHCDTQHQVGAGRVTGDGATHLTAGQHWYQVLAGDKTHRGHSHATYLGLQGMVDGGGESKTGGGGVAIVCREYEGWGVELVRSFGPNVAIFTVTSVRKCWYFVGAYMPPNNLPMVHLITHALACGTERVRKLLFCNPNACLSNAMDKRKEHLATVLAVYGLTDQERQFVPRRRYRSERNWAWRMWR